MNDYDFGKYYRRNAKSAPVQKSGFSSDKKIYQKLSIGIVAALILFFSGLMTGMQIQSNRIVHNQANAELAMPENSGVVNSADLSPEKSVRAVRPVARSEHSETAKEHDQSHIITQTEMANLNLKKSLMDPENEYIILAKKYNEESKDRALYYTGVLNKVAREYNYEVFPSIRGKTIKLYVGPMKGKKLAEKMLVKVKSIPEFTNSAILYKK